MLLPIVADVPHARAALHVEVSRAAPGRPFLAAVEIDTDPHWHVYWLNPGDSGVPTKIEWTVPKGWRVEPLEFPAPRRFTPGGVAAYGYEGKTLFLARVTPSATSGTIFAKAKWLVCASACIPGRATVATKVTVEGASRKGSQVRRLMAAGEALPRPAVGWFLEAARGKSGIVFTVAPPQGGRTPVKAEFFPYDSGLIDQSKRAVATLKDGRYVFKMDPSPFPEPRSRVEALLVFSDGSSRIVSTKLQRGNAR